MFLVVKIVVSGALLTYLVAAVDWSSAAAALQNGEPLALTAAVFVFAVQLPISAWKWQVSMRIHGLHRPLPSLLKIYCIASFFNNFLPTSVGGDVYRAYRTIPDSGRRSTAFSAVVLERITGLLALLVLGSIAALIMYIRDRDPWVGLMALAFSGPPLFALGLPTLVRFGAFTTIRAKLAGIKKLQPLLEDSDLIASDRTNLRALIGLSLLFQVLAIFAIVLLFSAVGVVHVAVETPVIAAASTVASLLPVSINGIGLLEGSFVLTAEELGVSFQGAVVVSLLLRVIIIAVSAIGALLFLADKKTVSA
jgi:glycosyltransferase 2 family protein